MHTHSTIPYAKIGSFLPYSKSFSLGGRETFGRKRNSTKPVPPNTLLKKKKSLEANVPGNMNAVYILDDATNSDTGAGECLKKVAFYSGSLILNNLIKQLYILASLT